MVADPNAPKPTLRAFRYDAQRVDERTTVTLGEVRVLSKAGGVLWVDVAGLGDASVISELGSIFGLHSLALEDVLSGQQRPKIERYGNVLFIVVRMPEPAEQGDHLDTDQLSLFLGTDFVISFQNRLGDCLDPIRERLRMSTGRLRTHGPDYLAYALLDATVDSFFPVLEGLGERLENLEDEVLSEPTNQTLTRIHGAKRDLLMLRRAAFPQRETIHALLRDPSELIRPETRVYLSDCYDHAVQVMDLLETYRELGSSLLEVWLSSTSNRLNEVMKVLTIISTIFMPLTFIVGVYGMNFVHMPELGSRWAYPAVLLVMALIVAGMLRWFHRKGWFRNMHAVDTRPPPENP